MSLFRDFRYAARQLRNRPSLTITIVATLAFCIGANTAVFTIVDRLFFRPPPYPEPHRLAVIATAARFGGASEVDTSQDGAQWQIVRDHASMLDSAVFAAVGGINLFANGPEEYLNHAEYVNNERVSAGFFHVLGAKPLVGREFTRAEDVPNGPPLVILSYGLWQRVFNGDAHVVGRTVELGGVPHVITGVMPAGFLPPSHSLNAAAARVDLWTPLRATSTGEGAGDNYEVIARLKPGATFAAVNAQLNSILRDYFARKQLRTHFEETALPLATGETYDMREGVHLMWAAVGVVLLIGCANIAALLLARAASRSREIATRLAIGATRRNIIRGLLAECVLLALAGGVVGIVLGQYALQALIGLNPGGFETWGPVALDARVVLLMFAVSLATSLLFGLFPAFETASIDLRSSLSEGGRSVAGSRRQWKRQTLVFAEVALGVVLVVSAGLLIRTFLTLVSADPGFDPHHVVVASASLDDARYRTAQAGARLFRESESRIRQIPGVESAAVALSPPYGRPVNDCVSKINGVALGRQIFCGVALTWATPGVFQTLRMPILRGTVFTESDTALTAPVAVVNKAFVRIYLNNVPNPPGSIVTLERRDWRVIGVTSDVQVKSGWGGKWGPIDMFPQMYVPAAQVPDDLFALANVWFSPVWIVRTRGDLPGLPEAMGRAIAAVDPRLPLSSFEKIQAVAGRSLQQQRYRATLFSVLAGLATLLAAIGVYGLIAEAVAQRTREMGIRLALGANSSDVVRTAAQPGIFLSVAGVAAGLLAAVFATRLLKHLIWGVPATDPTTFLAVAALLITVAAIASIIPALRLAKIDPAQTLRDE